MKIVGRLLVAVAILFVLGYGVFASSDAPYDPANSTVKIETLYGSGSGWHAGDGLIVTAAHVVKDREYVEIITTSGERFLGPVEYVDPARDVAFVRMPTAGGSLPAARYSCTTASIGAPIIAIGHALGMAYTATQGIIA